MVSDPVHFASEVDALRLLARELALSELDADSVETQDLSSDRERLRLGRSIRATTRTAIRLADDMAADWMTHVLERRFYTRDEEAGRLDRLVTLSRATLALLRATRPMWTYYQSIGGRAELSEEIEGAERRCSTVLHLAGEAREKVSVPWQPRDPERYAEAMRRANEAGAPAEVLLAELRRRADDERAAK